MSLDPKTFADNLAAVRTRVESAAEAFRSLQARAPVAVVMPVQLQDGPAENLLLRARSAGTRADFVVVAPEPRGSGERATLLADGVDEVLEGPVDPERVLAKLERLRDRRALIDGLGVVVRDPVMLELFDITGRKVAVPLDDRLNAGEHRVSVDTANMASGVYLYKLTAGADSAVKKMVINR